MNALRTAYMHAKIALHRGWHDPTSLQIGSERQPAKCCAACHQPEGLLEALILTPAVNKLAQMLHNETEAVGVRHRTAAPEDLNGHGVMQDSQ